MHVMSSVFSNDVWRFIFNIDIGFCAIQMSLVRITRLSAKANQAIQ